MNSKRINVLVYTGTGASPSAVQHTLGTLRSLLQPHYAVLPITSNTLLNEPWPSSCALLVFPGGGDLGYCRILSGAGNRRIRSYVANGGAYLGLCAGGYYGSRKCEFELGNEELEVDGERELGFFPGVCRGGAFGGFEYGNERGTRAVELRIPSAAFDDVDGRDLHRFISYANGGGVFVDAGKWADRDVSVLAEYTEEMDVDGGAGAAAVVHCRNDKGAAILTGPHPEFSASHLSPLAKGLDPRVIEALESDDAARIAFMRACLRKLGLETNIEQQAKPSLSAIHLSSADPSITSTILKKWEDETTVIEGSHYLKAEADTFQVEQQSEGTWSMAKLTRAALDTMKNVYIAGIDDADIAESTNNPNEIAKALQQSDTASFEDAIKTIIVHSQDPPSKETALHFDHEVYYAALSSYQSQSRITPNADTIPFGETLLYGETVTSTSTLLEKNPKFTTALPPGTTLTATHQLSGRGRGSNIWLSPPGSLMFSTVFTHPLSLNTTAPLVFIQYIAAIAVAEGVRTYDTNTPGYSQLGTCIRLKWPNDIYALLPSKLSTNLSSKKSLSDRLEKPEPELKEYTKIGGILVNTSYTTGDYTAILGIGLNVSNAAPTTSLNALVDAYNAATSSFLPHFTTEKLLARILTAFSTLYATFRRSGWSGELERLYLEYWLHSGTIVKLEEEGGVKARVKGITRDWGMLVAEEVGEDGKGKARGREFALQSDGNSFDFLRGLVRRKL